MIPGPVPKPSRKWRAIKTWGIVVLGLNYPSDLLLNCPSQKAYIIALMPLFLSKSAFRNIEQLECYLAIR